ncbi:tripartite tricarboxylate transporter substrate binding protein [Reyranella sp.]|uniref:Bug family tripartite tricarboxylate transporter substrate binding protein n=1 Tax=Reyranella sp. TaxID=1929291 RepID=UPI0027315DC2|nr:tripartite tricarboxylate transporter substrate binding protein [Reyranella sp.]MDP2378747.1 tripartite tricarboxylate transporter substrate binding protein [Reyranella sp.]
MTSLSRRSLIVAPVLLASRPGSAQTYPSKPIRWIVPYAAGGPADALVRAIAPKLSENLGVPVIVDNRGGAGGSLGLEQLAKSPPDGYTIALGGTGTHSLNPYIQANIPYDPIKDFEPVTPIVSYVNVLVVNAQVPVKTVAELVAYAKVNPAKVTFASGGTGASNHLAGELLKAVTGAPLMHVPYRGSGPAMLDVIAGHITCMFDILVTVLPQIQAGKVRALAVTSAKRSPYAPDIPTMAESGVAGYAEAGNDLWFGVFAPAGTPKSIVDRLNAEIRKALGSPDLGQVLRTQGYDAWTFDPTEFAAFIRNDHAKWGKVVKSAGIKPE